MNRTKKYLLTCFLAVFVSLLGATATMAASGTVAKIGSKKYTSLETAISKVKSGQTIVLQKDLSYTEILTINRSGVKFTLDLNEHTLTFKAPSVEEGAYLLIKKGSVTIKNGTIKQTGGNNCCMIQVNAGRTVTLESGTYKGGRIINKGTLKIKGGTLSKSWLENNGTLTISGGKLKGTPVDNYNGTVTISGGTFNADSNSSAGAVIYNSGEEAVFTIKGGSFSTTKGVPIIANTYSATLTIQDATVSFKNPYSDLTPAITSQDAKLTISGGTFTSNQHVIQSNGGTVKIKGGTFKTTGGSKCVLLVCGGGEIKTTGKITVTGGTFIAKKGCGYCTKTDSGKGTVTIKGGDFDAVKKLKKTTKTNMIWWM